MKRFQDLDGDDKEQLLNYPVYISLLASAAKEGLDEKEMKTVLKLTHIKTFGGDPLVADFYREAEKYFSDILANLDSKLPKDKAQREKAILRELDKLKYILEKLSPAYAHALLQSMNKYKEQVSKAHHNVLEYFIFPMPIKGLSN